MQSLLKAVPVSEIMAVPVVCISPTADVDAAAKLMREHKIGSLPVVAAGKVVGILTEADLLRQIVRADGYCCPEVEIVVSYP